MKAFWLPPFLFWTIFTLVVSRKIRPTHGALFHRLRHSYVAMITSEMLRAPVQLPTIQALTLLIMWSLPVHHQNEDCSWLYCGVMTNAALYMSLHHSKHLPSFRSIGVVSTTLQSRAVTWLGCFLSATMYVSPEGFMQQSTDQRRWIVSAYL